MQLDRIRDVGSCNIKGPHLVGIDPDFHLTQTSAHNFNVADPVDRFDQALDPLVGDVGHLAQAARRRYRYAQDRRRISVELLHNWDFGRLRQLVNDQVNFVAHFRSGHVGILLEHEINEHLRNAFDGSRPQFIDAADGVNRAFDLVGDFGFYFLRRSARIDDRNRDRRQIDLRKQIDAERSKGKQAHHGNAQNEHGREDRTTNTDFSKFLHLNPAERRHPCLRNAGILPAPPLPTRYCERFRTYCVTAAPSLN